MLARDTTRFGIAIPQMFPDGNIDMNLVATHLKHVEALGYESAWTQDQMMGVMPALEPFTLMTYAAAGTTRIKLGVSVLVLPYRAPLHVAKLAGTVDQISAGRLILGIGIGGGVASYPAFGITPERRVARFEESIEIIKRLWTESDVDYQGEFWRLDKANIEPKPRQRPHPPLVFGARVPAALRRAVKLGNGWMGAGSSSIPAFKQALDDIRGYLAEAGIDESGFPLSKRVYIAVDKDRDRVRRKLMEWFHRYYGSAELALKVAIWGGEEECIERLGEIYTEKLDMIMFNPVSDPMDQASILAENIIPKL